MIGRGAAWLALVAAVAGCARPGMPAGGDVPETPITVVESRPEAFQVLPPFDGPVVIEFQRRISERLTEGSLRDAVVVSPHVGEVEVRTRRRGIEISMEGGFRARTVYRITVLPRFQDLYQNRMAEPFDLVFSTADELEPNLLAGLVTDRLTLEEVQGARVEVTPVGEGFTHSTVTDSTGIFTFPHLPAGAYTLVAYEDLNRNREPDFLEPQDSLEVSLARGDTVIVTEPALLAPDTTAAVLQEAVPIDSLALRVTFDDHLDPEDPLDDVVARVVREDGDAPDVVEVLHVHEWEARVDDPDPAPADSPPGVILPARELVLILSQPLDAGVFYRVEVEEVTNINGIPGGGGEIGFEGPPEPDPDPDPAAPDPDADPNTPGPDAPDSDPPF